MKYIPLLTMLACTKHIHHKDMISVKTGMTYDQVVLQLGPPNMLFETKTDQYIDTKQYFKRETYIYRSHEGQNYIKPCYFVFADGILIAIQC